MKLKFIISGCGKPDCPHAVVHVPNNDCDMHCEDAGGAERCEVIEMNFNDLDNLYCR